MLPTIPRAASGRLITLIVLSLAILGGRLPTAAAAPVAVTTYHGDTMRTGWNAQEQTLTPAVVGGRTFGRLAVIGLDGQVDAEPLYVSGLTIAGGAHDTVFIVTENNTVYAIDANTGAILAKQHLGAPVAMADLPGGCNNNAATVGIGSTPVIDQASATLYLIAYTFEKGAAVYRLHALDLATLTDKQPSTVVAALQRLSGGGSYAFTASASRQRAALLEANGAIYAGFASYCDQAANVSRGWVLGWSAATLAPLPAAELIDRQANSPNDFFLSSVWMAGYGIAADEQGNLLFVTGNSDYSGATYKPSNNLAESVVKLSPDLARVESYFTPDAPGVDVATLDQNDTDFGSGGVLVLPQQPGAHPRLAVAAGKAGIMYLMDRDSLGAFHNDGVDHVLGSVNIQGGCWCGPSYFRGADGVGRVVSSGGATAIVWKLNTKGRPTLVQESAATINTGQDGSFFTTVSSNGEQPGTQIIWAVSHPVDSNPAKIDLYAFDPSTIDANGQMKPLYRDVAGSWPNVYGDANIVPMVANGRVFVASYRALAIFGVKSGTGAVAGADVETAETQAATGAMLPGHTLWGVVDAADADKIALRTRSGAIVTVARPAAPDRAITTGGAIEVQGDYDSQGVLRAQSILRAKPSPALWGVDR
jgi:outer membrane protein assembly factor BamB